MSSQQVKREPSIILLVEDNSAHAELVKRAFEMHKVSNKIYHVSDGEAVLDYLFRRGIYADPEKSPRPHLILLDLCLPRIDGLEVLKEIKTTKELAKIPVVVLTSSKEELDAARAYEYCANSYLVKPIDFDRFTQMMNDLGYYWLCWNYNPWS